MSIENIESNTDLAEPLTAEELQRLYEEQQRRLACPGCGEEPFIG